MSDDDWHVNMGDRKAVEARQASASGSGSGAEMKPGQVSDLIQLGPTYTLFRLNAHIPAGKTPFADVKAKLMTDLQKSKYRKNSLRTERELRKTAKIDVL